MSPAEADRNDPEGKPQSHQVQNQHFHEPLSRLHIVRSDPGVSSFLDPGSRTCTAGLQPGRVRMPRISPLAVVVFLLCSGAILLSINLLLGQEHTTRIN